MDQITQIKQNVDIVTLVGSYVALKKSGKSYKGVCPFHAENSPSFMVSAELQIYKCFGCGESGDIIKFVQKIEGLEFADALQNLADRAGIKLEKYKLDPDAGLKKELYWVNEQAANFYNHILTTHALGKIGLVYLKNKRGLSDATIKTFLLGYAPDSPDTLYKYFTAKKVDLDLLLKSELVIKTDDGRVRDRFIGRVLFPLTGIDEKVLGFTGRTLFDRTPKYLNTSETPVFHKSYFIYGLDKAKVDIKKRGAVLVEGQMDVIGAYEKGLKNTIATSGTSLTQGQLKILSRYTNALTFCFDSDTAGVLASFRAIELAENMGFDIKIAVIPPTYKDLDELVKHSVDEARSAIEGAVPAYDFLLFSIIKKHNKDSPDGKKKIVDEIIPWFSRIKNGVLRDHYTKQISQELGLDAETVTKALNSPSADTTYILKKIDTIEDGKISQQSLESYIITLLLKGGLDFMAVSLYKVDPDYYLDEKLKNLLVALKEHINAVKNKFDPNAFKQRLDAEQQEKFEELYLYEIDEDVAQDTKHFEKEFETALFRFKAMYAKRRMLDLSKQLKIAEKSNDTNAVQQLTSEFEQLKSFLVTQ